MQFNWLKKAIIDLKMGGVLQKMFRFTITNAYSVCLGRMASLVNLYQIIPCLELGTIGPKLELITCSALVILIHTACV